MNDDFETLHGLSANGLQRREEILRQAIGEAHRWRRRRHARRAVVVAVSLGAIVVGLLLKPHGGMPAKEVVWHSPGPMLPAPAPQRQEITIARIETDPTLVDRLATPPQKATWRSLNDDELLRELADAGHPAGLAYVDGRAELLWREPAAGHEVGLRPDR